MSVAPRRHGCLLTSTRDEDETEVNTREESQLTTVVEYLFFFRAHSSAYAEQDGEEELDKYTTLQTYWDAFSPFPTENASVLLSTNPFFSTDLSLSLSPFFFFTLVLSF